MYYYICLYGNGFTFITLVSKMPTKTKKQIKNSYSDRFK